MNLEPEPGGNATSEASMRPLRTVAISALALLGIAVAGVFYLHSTNRPANNESVTAPSTSRDPVTYSFATPMFGWAVVNPTNPSSSPARLLVFLTRDGAKHWHLQLTAESSGPGFVQFAVHFFDSTNGFMVVEPPSVGDMLYMTGNGGDTWETVQLPSSHCVVVTFSDFDHGLALAEDPAEPTSGQLFDLYATDDRGTTWQRLPNPPHDAYYLVARSDEAWMGSLGPGLPHAYVSTDAGRSWQRRDLPPPQGGKWPTSGGSTTVELLPERGVLVTGGVVTAPSAPIATSLFSSFDSGETWRDVPSPPGEVAFQNTLHWWAASANTLWKSADAGQSWTVVTDQLKWQMVPHIIDSKHAWASVTVVGGYGLVLTDDGGLNWRQADAPALS